MPTNTSGNGQISFGIADLLYAGGLRGYLESLKSDDQKRLHGQELLQSYGLPVCSTHEQIASVMRISLKQLRSLAFDRKKSHYTCFKLPKKTGGERNISAPKERLKEAQYWILHNILKKLEPDDAAHGFRRGRSSWIKTQTRTAFLLTSSGLIDQRSVSILP